MLDLNHLMNNYNNVNVEYYEGPEKAATGEYWPYVWNKPRGRSFAYMLLVGTGGNGGSGSSSVSDAAGGGGGGSGSQSMLLVPLYQLPETLVINVQHRDTFVGINSNTWGRLLTAGWAGDGGGASGTTPGVAGSGGSIATIAVNPLAGIGYYKFLAGQAGTAGSYNSNASNVTFPTSGLICSGGGGGGGHTTTAFNGGSVSLNAMGMNHLIQGGIAGTVGSTAPTTASSGYSLSNIFLNMGGGGGGSAYPSDSYGLRHGGRGAPGCGGGGGGAGGEFGDNTYGQGGKGGSAFCVIISW